MFQFRNYQLAYIRDYFGVKKMPKIIYECLDCGLTDESFSVMKSHCEVENHTMDQYDAEEE